MKMVDITQDKGMTSALNQAYADYEMDEDRVKATTRVSLIGRGLAIRSLRLREEQFKRNISGSGKDKRTVGTKKTPAKKTSKKRR